MGSCHPLCDIAVFFCPFWTVVSSSIYFQYITYTKHSCNSNGGGRLWLHRDESCRITREQIKYLTTYRYFHMKCGQMAVMLKLTKHTDFSFAHHTVIANPHEIQ